MFLVTVRLLNATKKAVAPGPRRALALLRQMRETHGVEPIVTADGRTYSEEELRAMADR